MRRSAYRVPAVRRIVACGVVAALGLAGPAMAHGQLATAAFAKGADGKASVADAGQMPRPELVLQVGHTEKTTVIAVSPDGTCFASGDEAGIIKVWESSTGACLRTLAGHAERVGYLDFSPDGGLLVSADGRSSNSFREIRLWNLATGRLVVTTEAAVRYRAPTGHALPFSTDGRWLAIPSYDRPLLVSTSDGRVVEIPIQPRTWMCRMSWSGDGRRIAVGDSSSVKVFEVPSLERVTTSVELDNDPSSVSGIALDSAGERLVFVDRTSSVCLLDLRTGRTVWKSPLPEAGAAGAAVTRGLRAVAVLEDRGCVAGVTDAEAIVWELSDGRERHRIAVGQYQNVNLSSDWGTVVASLHENRNLQPTTVTILVWHLVSGVLKQKLGAGVKALTGKLGLDARGQVLVATEVLNDDLGEGARFTVWETTGWTSREVSSGRTSHSEMIAWSPDGRWIASGPKVRIWNARTGAPFSPEPVSALIQTLSSGFYGYLAPNADGTQVQATVDMGGDTRKSVDIPIDPLTVACGAVRADKGAVATGGRDGGIRVWNMADGTLLRSLGSLGTEVTALAFEKEGSLLAAGGRNGAVAVWDVKTGAAVFREDGARSIVRLLHFARFSDRDVLQSLTADGWLRAWRTRAWGDAHRTRVQKSPIAHGLVWPLKTPSFVTIDEAGIARILDASTGATVAQKQLVEIPVEHLILADKNFGFEGEIGTVLAMTNRSHATWDVASGHAYERSWLPSFKTLTLLFDSESRYLALHDRFLSTESWQWEWRKGSESGWRIGRNGSVIPRLHSISFARSVAVRANYHLGKSSLQLLEPSTGKEIRRPLGHLETIDAVALAPDGKTMAVSSHSLPPNGSIHFSTEPDPIRRELRIWRLDDEKVSSELANPSSDTSALIYVPSGQLVTGDSKGEIRVWDVVNRRIVASATVPDGSAINSIAVTTDGGRLAVSSGSMVTVWSLAGLRLSHTLAGHVGAVGGVAFSPDGRLIVSGSVDGSTRLWDAETGEHLATLVSLVDDDGWLVATPDGLFDGSPDAWRHIRWRFGESEALLPVESYFADFYSPGLLAELLAGRRPKAKRDLAALDRRQPEVTVRAEAGDRPGTLSVEVDVAEAPADSRHPKGSGARDVRLFRNGSLVKAWRGDALEGTNRVRLRATVAAVDGENRLTAYAFNGDNVKSVDSESRVRQAVSRDRVARIVVVGVSQYRNSALDLRFAAADARAFGGETRRRLEGTGAFDRVEVDELLDGRATRAGILGALDRVAAKAEPGDVVMVLFAGHGISRGDRFYLVPHDVEYTEAQGGLDEEAVERIAKQAISDRDLELTLERVDAGHVVLVVDACFAGRILGADADEARTGPLNVRGLGQLAYEKGMDVLAAAGRDQRALESSKLKHGVLTYALIEEGMGREEADRSPADGKLHLAEWLEYAAGRVPKLHERLEREAAAGREIEHLSANEASIQTPRLFAGSGRRRPLLVASFGER